LVTEIHSVYCSAYNVTLIAWLSCILCQCGRIYVLATPLSKAKSIVQSASHCQRHQKGILMKQEMMGWQWHQMDHMQIICISFQICVSQNLRYMLTEQRQKLQFNNCCPVNLSLWVRVRKNTKRDMIPCVFLELKNI